MTLGKIEVMYEVMCADCGLAEHPPAQTKTDAAVILLSYGWRKLKKGWTCSDCVESQGHSNIAVSGHGSGHYNPK